MSSIVTFHDYFAANQIYNSQLLFLQQSQKSNMGSYLKPNIIYAVKEDKEPVSP